MFLSAWVLCCSLTIANLQRVTKLEEPENILAEGCDKHFEYFAHEYFIKTTIVRANSPQLQYCIPKTKIDVKETIDSIFSIYKKFNFTNSYAHVTPNSPITQSGVLSINDHQELPLFFKADIRHRHIRINADAALGSDTDQQMALMGQLTTDDRVYLLPYSLGGARGINIVPMAQNVHRLPGQKSRRQITDNKPKLSSLSLWRPSEYWILQFLQTYPHGRVTWSVAVQYALGVVSDPGRNHAFRPIGFARQFSVYMNESEKSLLFKSPLTTLLNNNDHPCGNPKIYFYRNIDDCRLPDATKDYGKFRWGLGKVTSKNVWPKPYVVSFPFTIGGQTFFYGQCIMDGRQWFIQELLPNGKMGEKYSRGKRAFYYKTVFKYSINGNHFLYSHTGGSGTYWFIQQLLLDGQMGQKLSHGNWGYVHHVSIPYTIKDKHYFYGQIESLNRWYIRELLENGTIGNITSYGQNINSVVFVHTLIINSTHSVTALYTHDPRVLNWQIQELFLNGTMGALLSSGRWTTAHHTSVPYSINGHYYFFGQNLHSGYWFVGEILRYGDEVQKIAEGKLEPYDVVFAYVVKKKHYMYGHNQRTKAWTIRELM